MSYSTVIRQGLFSVSIATVVVAASLGLAGTASAAELTHPLVLAAQTSPLTAPEGLSPEFCLFGKHKHGKGCRGGGVLKGSSGRCLNGAGGGLVDGGIGGTEFGPVGQVAGGCRRWDRVRRWPVRLVDLTRSMT